MCDEGEVKDVEHFFTSLHWYGRGEKKDGGVARDRR